MDLGEAKRLIGRRVCPIGGLDRLHSLWGCSRRAVRQCFDQAGPGGGYILAPSDPFFDADLALIAAFANEARCCLYAG